MRNYDGFLGLGEGGKSCKANLGVMTEKRYA